MIPATPSPHSNRDRLRTDCTMKVNDMAEVQLADVFVEMADTLVDDFDLIDFLHVLTERCVQLLGVSAAGLLLADGPESLQVVAHRPNAPACWSCSNCKPTKAHV